jgi:hypothetical protein
MLPLSLLIFISSAGTSPLFPASMRATFATYRKLCPYIDFIHITLAGTLQNWSMWFGPSLHYAFKQDGGNGLHSWLEITPTQFLHHPYFAVQQPFFFQSENPDLMITRGNPSTCMPNSRVGTTTIAWTAARVGTTLENMGRRYASVFPEPVYSATQYSHQEGHNWILSSQIERLLKWV